MRSVINALSVSFLLVFSSRLHWNLAPNPLSKLLAAKRAAGQCVLDLTESNPTQARLGVPAEPMIAALADPRAALYQPVPAGLEWARSAVSDYYHGRVGPERILLTTSTSEACSYLFKLLTDPGDAVLVPRPSYPLFEFLAGLEFVQAVPYSLLHQGAWTIDLDHLQRQATSRTRAIVLVNPNNPTGSFLKLNELVNLLAFCRERGLAIISDEVFADYAFGRDTTRVSSLVGVDEVLTFSLSGLSKIAGLPQMKLGWIVVSGPAQPRQAAIERLELIADTYLSVGAPVQWAAPKLLHLGKSIQHAIAERAAGNLQALRRALGVDSEFRLLEPEGGWCAVLEVPRTRTEEEWVIGLLGQDSVLVQPGFFYDFESEPYLVLSLLTPADVFEEGVGRLLHTV